MSIRFTTSITTLLVLVFTIQLGCKKMPDNHTIIEFQVQSGFYDSISFYLNKDSLAAYSSWGFEHAFFDSTGYLKLELDTEDLAWFFTTLFPNKYDYNLKNKSRVFMLIRPGESYRIEYDSTYQWIFNIKGDNEKAQNLFNLFNHTHGSLMRTWKTNSDTVPELLLEHLEDSINLSVKPFKELYLNEEIDSTYYHSVYNFIKYTQADALLDCLPTRIWLFNNPQNSRSYGDVTPLNLSQDEVQEIEQIVFDRYPISKKEAGLLPGLGFYIDKYLKFKIKADSIKIHTGGTYRSRIDMVNLATKYIDEDLVEMYFAHHFQIGSMKTGPDSLATYLYKEFKERYPESPFIPGIMRNIEGLTNFHSAFYPGLYNKKSNLETTVNLNQVIISPLAKIIQDNDSITLLDSILLQFRGKNLFVDFWASWCPPCRYEFRFADTLHHFLESHDIEMLYISIDEEEDKWKNALSNYDLKGYHYMATNPELRKELSKIVDFIPTYMIIDSTGKILNYNAESPHTKTVLYNQIKETLNIQE